MLVYQPEYPPQGNCESVIEILIITNIVHEKDAGSHRSRIREELAALWMAWSVYDRPMGQAVN